jgi:hypothetical protein
MSPRLSPLSLVITIGLMVGPVTGRAADWREYATAAMAPDYAWAQATEVEVPASRDRLTDSLSETVRAEFRIALTAQLVELQLTETRGNDRVAATLSPVSMVDEATPGLARKLMGAQLSHEFDGGGRLGAGVVVAEQQFASFGFGSERVDSHDAMRLVGNESASAAGVRLNFVQPLSALVSVEAALQSRINMQPFQSYRGVFSDPGDFDVPAEAALSARFTLSPSSGLTVGTRHVMYSELKAFSSYALPERFLSLLGDGTSPVFAWRDLTVYDLVVDHALGKATRVDFRYSTQQQPEPSSSLLYSALSEEFTDRNIAIGVSHRFDRAGELRLAASHAPVEYFLGTSSALGGGDASGEQVEFEARWRVDF